MTVTCEDMRFVSSKQAVFKNLHISGVRISFFLLPQHPFPNCNTKILTPERGMLIERQNRTDDVSDATIQSGACQRQNDGYNHIHNDYIDYILQ